MKSADLEIARLRSANRVIQRALAERKQIIPLIPATVLPSNPAPSGNIAAIYRVKCRAAWSLPAARAPQRPPPEPQYSAITLQRYSTQVETWNKRNTSLEKLRRSPLTARVYGNERENYVT